MGEVVALHWTYLLSAEQRRKVIAKLNKVDLTCKAVREAVNKMPNLDGAEAREVAVVGSEAVATVMNELADLMESLQAEVPDYSDTNCPLRP